jgi:hypothetical protein
MGPRIDIGTMRQFAENGISLDSQYDMEESYRGIFRCVELFRNFLQNECRAMAPIMAQEGPAQFALDKMIYVKDCLDSYMEVMYLLHHRIKEFKVFESHAHPKVLDTWDSDCQTNFDNHRKIIQCYIGLYDELRNVHLKMNISMYLDDPHIGQNLHKMLCGLQTMQKLLQRFE